MIVAIIPAAGRSVRMGRSKLALPLGDTTVLGRVIQTLRDGGVDRNVVVLGPHVLELEALAQLSGAEVCRLPHDTGDMRETVVHGLDWIEQHEHPLPSDAFLLLPGDIPGVSSVVIRRLMATYEQSCARGIVVPVFDGRRGHPALIAWRHAAGIRTLSSQRGIDSYLREHAADTIEVPVDDMGVSSDLDTPADYDKLLKSAPE
jgi:molybdenum cofactor cytidylyltransferase